MIKEYLNKINIVETEDVLKKFKSFSELLLDWNEKINLTAITDEKEIEIKHFIDSLTIFKTGKIKEGMSVIDIGCGAGFPSFPMKFAMDSLNVVQLDSLNKRVNFLNTVASELNLKGIEALHFRAEEGAKKENLREKFDIACARAVASLPTLIELCIPYVKVGGYFIALKGSEIDEEIINSKNALGCLYSEIEDVISLNLPEFEHKRNIVVIKKLKSTNNKYPRNAPKPVKSPL